MQYTPTSLPAVLHIVVHFVMEAVHAFERMMDRLAVEVEKDPAQLRMENFIKKNSSSKSAFGWNTTVAIIIPH
jgi:CO/xanthine dehydrogenase Mo-binding subunit